PVCPRRGPAGPWPGRAATGDAGGLSDLRGALRAVRQGERLAMKELQVEGRAIPLDKDGYLADLNDWNAAVADALALREGLELSAEHWEILHLLRDFYAQFQLRSEERRVGKEWRYRCGLIESNDNKCTVCSDSANEYID